MFYSKRHKNHYSKIKFKSITLKYNLSYYLNMMHIIFITLFFILFSSCSTKYKGLHTNYSKFNTDIEYCLKKSCKNKTKNVLQNLSVISSTLAYGGGGGGGSTLTKYKISYKAFNLCLKEKGYIKDKNGIFEMPYLTCDWTKFTIYKKIKSLHNDSMSMAKIWTLK